ncbi:hypothetical protein D5R81_17440 [Parashewanella spongiae]|uniref:Uncharacterized protein n=2 Tax=Parashewanella spongiae TaxID=342950 RepID=A0A3A6TP08_9GAMM|nr:helix-turn-helix transcriptional regulator [Parashewanella spongiae]RJY06681.1 hypothetical protein D5R81_17440 [Parashewanella spongiae]
MSNTPDLPCNGSLTSSLELSFFGTYQNNPDQKKYSVCSKGTSSITNFEHWHTQDARREYEGMEENLGAEVEIVESSPPLLESSMDDTDEFQRCLIDEAHSSDFYQFEAQEDNSFIHSRMLQASNLNAGKEINEGLCINDTCHLMHKALISIIKYVSVKVFNESVLPLLQQCKKDSEILEDGFLFLFYPPFNSLSFNECIAACQNYQMGVINEHSQILRDSQPVTKTLEEINPSLHPCLSLKIAEEIELSHESEGFEAHTEVPTTNDAQTNAIKPTVHKVLSNQIALKDVPIVRIKTYLRSKNASSLPPSVETFLNTHIKFGILIKIDNPKACYSRIIPWLRDNNVTNYDLSLMVNLKDHGAINLMFKKGEKGGKRINLLNFCALAMILGKNPQWLLTGQALNRDLPPFAPFDAATMMLESGLTYRRRFILCGLNSIEKSIPERKLEKEEQRFLLQFKKTEYFSSDTLIENNTIFQTSKLRQFINRFIDDKLPNVHKSKAVIQNVLLKFINLLDSDYRLTPHVVCRVAKIMWVTPYELIKGEYPSKRLEADKKSKETPISEIYYKKSILFIIRQYSLHKKNPLPKSIIEFLDTHTCGQKYLSKKALLSKSTKSYEYYNEAEYHIRLECQCEVLGISKADLHRIVTGNPDGVRIGVKTTYNRSLLVEELCASAYVLGVRPQWLLSGLGAMIDDGQLPYLTLPKHTHNAHRVIFNLFDQALKINKSLEIPEVIFTRLSGLASCVDTPYVTFNKSHLFTHFYDRLSEEIRIQGSKEAFVSIYVTGISTTIQSIRRQGGIKHHALLGFAMALNLHPDWLIKGTGNKYISNRTTSLIRAHVKRDEKELKMLAEYSNHDHPEIETPLAFFSRYVESENISIQDDVMLFFLTNPITGDQSLREFLIASKATNPNVIKDQCEDKLLYDHVNFTKEKMFSRIKRVAEGRGVTLTDISRRINKSSAYLSSVLHHPAEKKGSTYFKRGDLALISHLLGCAPAYFITGVGRIREESVLSKLPLGCMKCNAKKNMPPQLKKLGNNAMRSKNAQSKFVNAETRAPKRSRVKSRVDVSLPPRKKVHVSEFKLMKLQLKKVNKHVAIHTQKRHYLSINNKSSVLK